MLSVDPAVSCLQLQRRMRPEIFMSVGCTVTLGALPSPRENVSLNGIPASR